MYVCKVHSFLPKEIIWKHKKLYNYDFSKLSPLDIKWEHLFWKEKKWTKCNYLNGNPSFFVGQHSDAFHSCGKCVRGSIGERQCPSFYFSLCKPKRKLQSLFIYREPGQSDPEADHPSLSLRALAFREMIVRLRTTGQLLKDCSVWSLGIKYAYGFTHQCLHKSPAAEYPEFQMPEILSWLS